LRFLQCPSRLVPSLLGLASDAWVHQKSSAKTHSVFRTSAASATWLIELNDCRVGAFHTVPPATRVYHRVTAIADHPIEPIC
jgi:hypothetical protein